ncbi:hypothetical protein FIBSPDRAFT_862115 [Athelia psychrophila]|uniref:Uncharacterized protein n=1 Tax=Athelia psychrophila TaxID=1759441 RepID=A0A166IRZ4_9AGAM|nr:hypothetical protein FIBSPDRAFT_863417 [Fibularhizoctonia sp. CBS 109695]KZP20108.1 hypothetical protein FIBSPDRAFT_862115 [Fibularhizoctonia sp. CBS 109695]
MTHPISPTQRYGPFLTPVGAYVICYTLSALSDLLTLACISLPLSHRATATPHWHR